MKRFFLGTLVLLLMLLAACGQPYEPELETQSPIACNITLAKSWRGATLLGSSAGVALSSDFGSPRLAPHVAVSANGDAFAVWLAFDGVDKYAVYARRYTRPPLNIFPIWEPAMVIGTFKTLNGARVSDSPRVAMDGSGNTIVVWEQNDIVNGANLTRIYARRFMPVVGWGALTRLDTANLAGRPRIAMNAGGNAVVVWEQQSFFGSGVFSRRFTNGVWFGATQVESGAAFSEVSIDANGNAIAVWLKNGKTQARRSSLFGAWLGLTTMDSPVPFPFTSSSTGAKIAMDANGNAIVTWLQTDFFNLAIQRILARRFTPAIGWDVTATSIENPTNPTLRPQVAMDSSRNATVVWRRSDGNPLPHNNYARVLTSNGTLIPASNQNATPLEFRNETPEPPVVGMSAGGNGIALWAQSDGTALSIYANHLTHQLPTINCPEKWSWGNTPVLLEASNQSAFTPQLAMYSGGNAVAVWTENVGNGMNIYANVYR